MYRRILTAVFAAALLGLPLAAETVTVYFNDFDSSVGPYLSVSSGTLAIVAPHPACSSPTYCTPFLGVVGDQGAQPFDYQIITLTLSGLPAHTSATVSLALFILGSWDGNNQTWGPDYWTLAVGGGPTLWNTTFSIAPHYQCYPDNCPAGYPSRTGATENNTLGWRLEVPPYGWFDNSVYLLSSTFSHTGSSLVLNFQAIMYSDSHGWPADEGWGMDNLKVELSGVSGGVIPEPSSLLLFGSGLAALAVALRRKLRS